jgi:hypothetical protein
MAVTLQQSLSNLKSERIVTNLNNVSPIQNTITYNGGYSFNFVDFLQNVNDVKTKSYTNFYLTDNCKLTDNIYPSSKIIQQPKYFTTIRTGTTTLNVIPLTGTGIDNISFYYELIFSTRTNFRNLFEIDFINNEYCTISYSDSLGTFYLVLDDSDKAVLKRSIFCNENFDIVREQHFRYVLNENRLILLKEKNSTTLLLQSVGQNLSGINTTNGISNLLFKSFAFTLDKQTNIKFNNALNTSYVTYNHNDLTIDKKNSSFDLDNNYLLYRNLEANNLNTFNIITLKNQSSDNNLTSISNNLDLGNLNSFNVREYTSLSNSINQEEDEGLEINYVFYNKAINIKPGINYFTTESTFIPLTQLNINDSKIANQGAFSTTIPFYSDKIYTTVTNSIGGNYTYLCTWLSGAPFSNEKIWVDRYYYPDIISKQEALSSRSIAAPTYTTYIEKLIEQNSSLSYQVERQHYFDKKSDLCFRPNTAYRYDRIDPLNVPLLAGLNMFDQKKNNYFDTINKNGGFTLSFNILNYDTSEQVTLFSRSNRIYGGVRFVFSRDSITFTYILYDNLRDNYTTYEKTVPLIEGAVDNIIFSVNNAKGELYFFVNGDLALKENFYPSYFSTVLYGDLVLNNNSIYDAGNYIEDVFLTFTPLDVDELYALVVSKNAKDSSFYISLPCGMRNKLDNISQLNTVNINQQSKSNYIDVYINNIGIDEKDMKEELQKAVIDNIIDDLPVNININSIKIVS